MSGFGRLQLEGGFEKRSLVGDDRQGLLLVAGSDVPHRQRQFSQRPGEQLRRRYCGPVWVCSRGRGENAPAQECG